MLCLKTLQMRRVSKFTAYHDSSARRWSWSCWRDLRALVRSGSSRASPLKQARAAFLRLARERHRQIQRPVVQPVAARGSASGPKAAEDQDQAAAVELGTSDYVPNMQLSRPGGITNITIAAGFHAQPTRSETIARRGSLSRSSRSPTTAPRVPRSMHHGRRLKARPPERHGSRLRANQSGCLVGYLAAETGRRSGGNGQVDRSGRRSTHIPPVDIWIAGYRVLRQALQPKIRVLVGYSGDFVRSDLCKTVAENQNRPGREGALQVAGDLRPRHLTAAAQARSGASASTGPSTRTPSGFTTSGVKEGWSRGLPGRQGDQGQQVQGQQGPAVHARERRHGHRQISPAVPKKYITAMNKIKTQHHQEKLRSPKLT